MDAPRTRRTQERTHPDQPGISHAFVGQPATFWQKLEVINFGAELLHEASVPAPVLQ
jgi:hypothetical protein